MSISENIPEGVKVKSLYKAIQVLFFFTRENEELGVTELADKSGMLKSSVYNILSTFEVCGIVERNKKTNKYRLGVRVLELSNQFYQNNDIKLVMKPFMQQIADLEEECVYLAVLSDLDVVYIDAAFPASSTGGRNMTGVTAPTYCTGIGKAMLAYERAEVIDRVVEVGFQSFTHNTITTGEKLKEELEQIRQRGYSIDNMEHEHGIKCVAVPIVNKEGQVVGGYSISGPSPRFNADRIKKLAVMLQNTAKLVQNQL